MDTTFNGFSEPRHTPRWPWIFLAAVLIVAGAGLYLLRSGNLERIGRSFLNRQLAGVSNVRISWRHMRGNPLHRVDITGLRVELSTGGQWHSFLDAEELTVDAGIPQ